MSDKEKKRLAWLVVGLVAFGMIVIGLAGLIPALSAYLDQNREALRLIRSP